MQAKETRLRNILEGQNQYVIPLFQRTYSWEEKHWQKLWDDVMEMLDQENPRTHFIGSIVSMPTVSVPEGVAKYLLIDGQQRITTVFILLTLLRDKAQLVGEDRLANEIQDTLLVNGYQDGNDYYKLMPTQADRQAYKALVDKGERSSESQIQQAYDFFNKKMNQIKPDLRRLKEIIRTNLALVSIVLDTDDNPHLVFESLNATGRPLTQADLIRNYFFMRIHASQQDDVFQQYWFPMQTMLGASLSEFIRHYLMRSGAIVRQTEIYQALKDKVSVSNALTYLQDLHRHAGFYQKLLDPTRETSVALSRHLVRLNRIEVTTAYPLLLSLYNDYEQQRLSVATFADMLGLLENYLIRRFVCGYPTNQLNKVFPTVYAAVQLFPDNPVSGLKQVLQTKGYPRDTEFMLRFRDTKLYGSGDRRDRTQLVLESLEEHYRHKEQVSFAGLTIEHIMPQTLTDWWQAHLGENWAETHEILLHTVGNLTLTAYNSELSNDSFPAKQNRFAQSHLELNRYFPDQTHWTSLQIDERATQLATRALAIWPYFGNESQPETDGVVTGTTPTQLMILGEQFEVRSWRDVLLNTLNTIAFLEPDKFAVVAVNFPHLITPDKGKLREHRQLNNGAFVEINLSAKRIEGFCRQTIQTAGLSPEDWQVSFVRNPA